MPQTCDMGPTALLPFWRKACWGFYCPENSWRLRPGLNPQTWVLKGSTLPLDHQSHLWYELVRVGNVRAESCEQMILDMVLICWWLYPNRKFCHIEQWMLHIVVPDRSSELVEVTLWKLLIQFILLRSLCRVSTVPPCNFTTMQSTRTFKMEEYLCTYF